MLAAAAKAAQQPQQAPPPGIQPHPVPMTFRIGQATMPDGAMGVVMLISTPLGELVYFLDSKMASHVSDGLKQAASAAASGLLVPGQ